MRLRAPRLEYLALPGGRAAILNCVIYPEHAMSRPGKEICRLTASRLEPCQILHLAHGRVSTNSWIILIKYWPLPQSFITGTSDK